MGDQGTTSLNNLPSENVYEPNANIVMETTNIQNQPQMQSQNQPQTPKVLGPICGHFKLILPWK